MLPISNAPKRWDVSPESLSLVMRPAVIARRASSVASVGGSNIEHHLLEGHARGTYQVVREIGRGGMGVVFLARDVMLHRLVAIKVLRAELSHMEEQRERFRREARITAQLHDEGIVAVHGFGESADLV